MKITKSTIILSVLLLFFLGLNLSGCSNQINAAIRKVTYPPNFKYTEPNELRSEMAKLGQQMALLDQALMQTVDNNQNDVAVQRQQVLTALYNIDTIASGLQASDAGANHPFMQDFMQQFVNTVTTARSAASLAEPRYYFAGKVSGACVNCHKVNR